MKVLVTGDRNGTKGSIMYEVFERLHADYGENLFVVHGAARGVDLAAEALCKHFQINYQGFPAKWGRYNKAAGPIRNEEMLYHNPDIELVLAFHDDIKNSKGTKDMLKRVIKKGILVRLYEKGELTRVFNPQQLEIPFG